MKNIHILLFYCTLISLVFSGCDNRESMSYKKENRLPDILPDYTNITIPRNIAPLNFIVNENGQRFQVKLSSKSGKPILISSSGPHVIIDGAKWHKLLNGNSGNELTIEVYVKNNSQWTKFKTISNKIAAEEIDKYIAYRRINAGYELWYKMGVYQRNMENFEESPIVENSYLDHACVNCHSFCKNDPSQMSLHIRAKYSGTIITQNKLIKKVNTKVESTISAGVYPAWHPRGKLIAYSTNIINQFFNTVPEKSIDVSDNASDIIIYNVEKNSVSSPPKLSTKNRENMPEWSADGKYLYYISSPEATDLNKRIYGKYDLVRIAYDINKNAWGEVDTVLTSSKAGMSITFPKVSPDGKYLLFCMTDYGYFSIHYPKTDLYVMDLKTRKYWKSEANSDKTESYHSWSSNGRWFVFSSRRLNGQYTRTFISYFTPNGKCSKPFVLPQRDPLFYNSCLENFNRPEMIKNKVEMSPLKIRDAAYSTAEKATEIKDK